MSTLALSAREHKPLGRLEAEQNFAIALSNRLQEVPQEKTAAPIVGLDAEDPAYREATYAAYGGVATRDRRDGLRLTLGDGPTGHFRASGNAPELRVYVEALDQDAATGLLREGLDFARKGGRLMLSRQ